MENKIYEKYTNPSIPGSFSGISGFLKNNKFNSNLSKKVISSLPTYSLHKPIKFHFERNKTLVNGIDDQWQADLVDLSKLSGSNSKYKYILTCIDVFSKFAWAEPLLNKSAETTTEAFKKILSNGRKPNLIYSDDGNEFKGECKKFLKDNNIELFVTNSKNKATVVERFNRTLKEKMYRYFTFNKSQPKSTNLHEKRYIDILPQLIKSYNNSYHRSIKTTPSNVNKQNESKIFENLYGYKKEEGDKTFVKIKFKKGSYVRIVKNKSLFEKGYTQGWSKEIFIVNKILPQVPLLYQLTDLTGKTNKGVYYAEELQQVQLTPIGNNTNKNIIKENIIKEQINLSNIQNLPLSKTNYSLRPRKK